MYSYQCKDHSISYSSHRTSSSPCLASQVPLAVTLHLSPSVPPNTRGGEEEQILSSRIILTQLSAGEEKPAQAGALLLFAFATVILRVNAYSHYYYYQFSLPLPTKDKYIGRSWWLSLLFARRTRSCVDQFSLSGLLLLLFFDECWSCSQFFSSLEPCVCVCVCWIVGRGVRDSVSPLFFFKFLFF